MPDRPPFDAILLDMDGVLFHGDRALPQADDFLRAIRGIPHCFVTNNPIRSPQAIVAHFARLGLPAPRPEDVITSGQATARWLDRRRPGFRYFAVGAGALHDELAAYGTADAERADVVVVGEGPGLDFSSLTTGINLILGGAELVCTNPDQNVDATVDGAHRVLPGGGALVAPFAVATGVEPVFVGKPWPMLFEMALAQLDVTAARCVMVGDRPDTDIAGAQSLGMLTALVRTGRFDVHAALPPGIGPHWDCAGLGDLMAAWGLA